MGDYDEKTKRVLLLGAGYVSAPVVEYLTRSNDIAVSVGNRSSFSIFVFKRIFIIYENENANVFSHTYSWEGLLHRNQIKRARDTIVAL